ncbi:MAG: hypothetical protein U1F83_03150 [Verrucomicrobiota bacterium]
MSNLNRNKPAGKPEPGNHPQPSRLINPPATEEELDALRYRGTPIRRFGPRAKSQDAETSSRAAGASASPNSPKAE